MTSRTDHMHFRLFASHRSALTALAFLIATSGIAVASTEALIGEWEGNPVAAEDLPECANDEAILSFSGSDSDLKIAFEFGDVTSITGSFVPGATEGVYTRKAGIMSRLGLSDETTRDQMIQHERVVWARKSQNGIILYGAQITEAGGLDMARIALDPVDGGVVASIDIDNDECRIADLSIPLFKD
ncbi:MAG: hypothetical protein AAGA88_12285 [Pseudomonadota bacterium]